MKKIYLLLVLLLPAQFLYSMGSLDSTWVVSMSADNPTSTASLLFIVVGFAIMAFSYKGFRDKLNNTFKS